MATVLAAISPRMMRHAKFVLSHVSTWLLPICQSSAAVGRDSNTPHRRSTPLLSSSCCLPYCVSLTSILPSQPQYECDNSGNCKPGDKWPYGMCSLKKLANADKPEFWSNNPGEWGARGRRYHNIPIGWGGVFSCHIAQCAGCDGVKQPLCVRALVCHCVRWCF
jgi:hypothetical protein